MFVYVENVNLNRTNVDQLIKNEDNIFIIIETKLTDGTQLRKGQEAAQKHVGSGSGSFIVRSDIKDWGIKKGDKINVTDYRVIPKYKK